MRRARLIRLVRRVRPQLRARCFASAVRRGNYCCVTADDVAHLSTLCDIQDEDLEHYNNDWMKKFAGDSQIVLKPNTTEQVAEVLAYCNEKRLAVVPQGGNTGLVGGSVPVFDEVVLSLERMNRILGFDEMQGVVQAEAGVILQNLDDFVVNEHGHLVPIDLGARGSCQLGGNLSTNAGGVRYVRYGSLRGNVVGLEVVKADGTILSLMSEVKKDNTGYDLKQLFIGSEGTLGVITKVALQCYPSPPSRTPCLLACRDFESVTQVLLLARRVLGESLSAIEYMDQCSVEMVQQWKSAQQRKEEGSSNSGGSSHSDSGGSGCSGGSLLEQLGEWRFPFYVLIEVGSSDSEHDRMLLERLLEQVLSPDHSCDHSCDHSGKALVEDGMVAAGGAQAAAMWEVRDNVSVAMAALPGQLFLYDLSVPVRLFDEFSDEIKRVVGPMGGRVASFGHLGDSNLHLNVLGPSSAAGEEVRAMGAALEPHIFELASDFKATPFEGEVLGKGSISAEHGLGQTKNHLIHLSKPLPAVEIMLELKALFDPNSILNPYKVLPPAANNS